MIDGASIARDLSEIQRRLRSLQTRNERALERLALKFHREEVEKETGSSDAAGELDAQSEATKRAR